MVEDHHSGLILGVEEDAVFDLFDSLVADELLDSSCIVEDCDVEWVLFQPFRNAELDV